MAENRAKRLPFSVGWDEVYWQSWAELVGQDNGVIVVAQKRPWMVSDLLVAVMLSVYEGPGQKSGDYSASSPVMPCKISQDC
jgi:hypothetical protein